MKIIDPRVDPKLMPEGSKPMILNGKDREYQDLPAIRTPKGYVVSRWEPTEEERLKIYHGEDIYLTIVSKGSINPVFLTVGPCDWRKGEKTL